MTGLLALVALFHEVFLGLVYAHAFILSDLLDFCLGSGVFHKILTFVFYVVCHIIHHAHTHLLS